MHCYTGKMERPEDKPTNPIKCKCTACGYVINGKSTYHKLGEKIIKGCKCGGNFIVIEGGFE